MGGEREVSTEVLLIPIGSNQLLLYSKVGLREYQESTKRQSLIQDSNHQVLYDS